MIKETNQSVVDREVAQPEVPIGWVEVITSKGLRSTVAE
jgi:hypothetical protein